MNDIDFMMVLVAVLANMVQRIHLIGCYLENDRNAGGHNFGNGEG